MFGVDIRGALVLGVAMLLGHQVRAQEPTLVRPRQGAALRGQRLAGDGGYAGTSLVTDDRPTRIVAAATVRARRRVLKEVWDLTGHGDASWRDLTWDVVGTTTGVLLAYAIDWAIGRLRGHRPPMAT
jgi:hypothetical protein